MVAIEVVERGWGVGCGIFTKCEESLNLKKIRNLEEGVWGGRGGGVRKDYASIYIKILGIRLIISKFGDKISKIPHPPTFLPPTGHNKYNRFIKEVHL